MNLLNGRMPPCAIVFRIVIAIGIFGILLGALTYFDTYYSKDFVGMPILPKQRNFITRFHWEIQLLVVAFFDQILTMSSWAQLSEETDTCFTFYTSCTIIRFIWNSQDVWFDIYWYFIEWFFRILSLLRIWLFGAKWIVLV